MSKFNSALWLICGAALLSWFPGAERRSAAKLLTEDEARRIAAGIAKLPELLRKS